MLVTNSPKSRDMDRALVWLRRDLRLDDQAALYHACREAHHVWCAFVFDTDILRHLPPKDRRVEFILDCLGELDGQLQAWGRRHGHTGVRLIVRHGQAAQSILDLARTLRVQAVFANRDYEPQAVARDAQVRGLLADAGIALRLSKDQVIFDTDEVMTGAGRAYAVFTPYKTAWLKRLEPFFLRAYPNHAYADALANLPASTPSALPTLQDLGFAPTNLHTLKLPPGGAGGQALLEDFLKRIDGYHRTRDFPGVKGPSYLSTHLRFGTVSIRLLAREAWSRTQAGCLGAQTWLSELIWREFYQQILHHHPHVVEHCFRPDYDHIRWEHGETAEAAFSAWCEARTGYPLVDAAMHQLNETGYMHNRLRMVTASFLIKDLGIDWRWGERYFAEKLNDFDLAANNGGWQWAASTGCDAQPYFRIFNPVSQSKKFDPEGRFIRRYLPVLARLETAHIHAPWLAPASDLAAADVRLGDNYPAPMVAHEVARDLTLQRYAAVSSKKTPRPSR